MFDRLAAALFSACAALATLAVWTFFHSHTGAPMGMFKQWAVPVALAAGVFGFFAGTSLTGSFWGNVWETRSEPTPLLSLSTALTLIVIGAIAYGIYKHVMP